MKLHPNAQRVGCAFLTLAANGQIWLQAYQSRQRSARCTSQFVEQLSLELCIVDHAMRLNASLMMPIPSASKHFRIIASSKPLLSKVSQPQVIWSIRSPHFGRHPARIDRVAENVGPNSSDGCGKGRHEELAVRVGTSGSATSPLHATQGCTSTGVHTAAQIDQPFGATR